MEDIELSSLQKSTFNSMTTISRNFQLEVKEIGSKLKDLTTNYGTSFESKNPEISAWVAFIIVFFCTVICYYVNFLQI